MITIVDLLGQVKIMPPHAGRGEYVRTYDCLDARVQGEDHARNFDKDLIGFRRLAKWLERRAGK